MMFSCKEVLKDVFISKYLNDLINQKYHKHEIFKMTQLQILTQFSQLFIDTKQSLDNYNNNVRNEQFEKDPDDTFEQAYNKGEAIFDRRQEDIRNITELIDQEEEIIKFFAKCKENKQIMIHQNNKLIDKLIELKKNIPNVSREEIKDCKDFWNERRNETEVERMNRETKEMLEEVREEKAFVVEMSRNMIEKERQLNELIEKAKVIEFKNELNEKMETIENHINMIAEKQNEMNSNYVKKNEILTIYNQVEENEKREKFNQILDINEMNQLENWTNKKCSEIVFNSDKDKWDINTSVLEDKLGDRSQLVFLIKDTDNNKFGYYLSLKGATKYGDYYSTDENTFLFSLKSNGRLNRMMKFEIKDTECGYTIKPKSDDVLIQLGSGSHGAIHLMKLSKKSESYCYQDNDYFNYHGTINPLNGKSNKSPFTPQRITVIQMK